MGYMPKTIKGKMNFKNMTNEEMLKCCACKDELESVRKFYEKLNGQTLILSLWDYDNYMYYHLTSWHIDIDNLMSEAMFILESEFGVYNDFEEFKKDWDAREYDCGGSIVFLKDCVEELMVISEEAKE